MEINIVISSKRSQICSLENICLLCFTCVAEKGGTEFTQETATSVSNDDSSCSAGVRSRSPCPGVQFSQNCEFKKVKSERLTKARNAIFSLRRIFCTNGNVSPKLALSLFNSKVLPILMQVSILSGYHPDPRATNFPSKFPAPGQLFSAKLRPPGRKHEAKIPTPRHNLPSLKKRSMKRNIIL